MAKGPKPRPRRQDSFFGLHFDLHPGLKDTELGRLVTPRMVRRIIRAAHPDYIQYDCKGHPGVLGYPDSKVSRSSPGIVNDSLAVYRQVTAEEGVALYVHFSGVWDRIAGEEHPEWCAVTADGTPDKEGRMSTFGPYVVERMIPQMMEVIDRYQVDGFWVDGECWSLQPDHCPEARRRFKEQTGSDSPPTKPGEPLWLEWMTIQRDQFFAYLKTYMDAVHAHAPQVQIASNWLYSPFAPEPVKLPVDFISGDYNCVDSVNSARFNGRQMSRMDLPWDLMAWAFVSFRGHGGRTHKTALMLQQEAAAVLALGGGFQFYFHPDRHGGFADHQIALMKHVADFCHARRDVCFRTHTVPQVAVLLDLTTYLTVSPKVYAPWAGEFNALQGVLHAVLEAGHAADVICDHHLPAQVDRWPVIVVPESDCLPRGVVQELTGYAHRGGSVLVCGARTCGLFRDALGVRLVGEPTEQKAYLQVDRRLSREPGSLFAPGLWQEVELTEKAKPQAKGGAHALVWRTPGHFAAHGRTIAATLTPHGRGRIIAVYGPPGATHFHQHTPWGRELMRFLLNKLYRPIVALGPDTPPVIDLFVREKDGQLNVHLNNVTGMPVCPDTDKHGYFFTDYVPPTPPIKLSIRLPRAPKRVTLEPVGKRLRGVWGRGVLKVTVPPVHIHSAVVVER